jgi:hypothetical protein
MVHGVSLAAVSFLQLRRKGLSCNGKHSWRQPTSCRTLVAGAHKSYVAIVALQKNMTQLPQFENVPRETDSKALHLKQLRSCHPEAKIGPRDLLFRTNSNLFIRTCAIRMKVLDIFSIFSHFISNNLQVNKYIDHSLPLW